MWIVCLYQKFVFLFKSPNMFNLDLILMCLCLYIQVNLIINKTINLYTIH